MPVATYTQKGRPLTLTTPLGPDALLAVELSGQEGLSHLYHFHVAALAPRSADGKPATVPFDKLLGQPVVMTLALPKPKNAAQPKDEERFFHGICSRVSQGESDAHFTRYYLDIVPRLWLLTRVARSRIFQHLTVQDILKKVLVGFPVEFKLPGPWHRRDFCVQYRETDFNFACRLMEEEGIHYFFRHEAKQHVMVVANTPETHPCVPGAFEVVYQNVSMESAQDQDHITSLEKVQEQVPGKFTLWDHTFELPHEHLEATKPITDTIKIGAVVHNLKTGDNGQLEVYDWPGEYAQRFDGVDQGGGEQPAETKKIQPDGERTVSLRMQARAASAVQIRGGGSARQLVAGHKFRITTRKDDKDSTPLQAEDQYVLTAVTHSARLPATYRTGAGSGEGFYYQNSFTAIPLALPFRPPQMTPKPVVSGTQTAVVVGPRGEEIFTDKYGRIKVQFHWDRERKNNADSSCWVRVVQVSAGRGWGAFHLPRIGQEVVIDFQEGDPDQPICIGSVYNPDQMPKYKLPDEKTKSYIRTNTSPGGVGHNEIRFEDKKDKEQIYVHAEKNMDVRVKNDSMERVIHDRHLIVGFEKDGKKGGDQREEVLRDQHLKVHRNKEEHVGGNLKLLVGGIDDGPGNVDVHLKGAKKELIDGTSDLHVKKDVKEKFDENYDLHVERTLSERFEVQKSIVAKQRVTKVGSFDHLTVGQDYAQKTGLTHSVDAGKEIILKAGMKVVIEAGMELTIKAGTGFIKLDATGVTIVGTLVNINSGGAPGTGIPLEPYEPGEPSPAEDATDANPTKPNEADNSTTGQKSN